ncbi:cytochrome P450 2D20 [Verticillium alfalfae VaMs.102]|uniref:Cytochrome P450 2D20 n=1 Tax=Verticillium alfalfae (strain VaMs.102 / ATCC MYA-4576 / FGSC 10136) TaxID=526221 RepID=C9SJJ4_VERA1|nr:cytochrome P450 2D20 [Verticillium alfalfae VaMs.102]EEY18356.1 cytochrome P450 2D20 [Verticillium alfalfae VaMs.102]
MGLPWRPISWASLVIAVSVTYRQPVFSRQLFLWAFASSWLLSFLGWAVWAIFLWPKLFSSLRSLPGPNDNHWLMGQFPKIGAEATGLPMMEWSVCSFHHPKRFSEVLVTRNYDFEKPNSIRWSLGRSTVVEISGWASRVTLDIIGVAGLGRDFGAVRDPNNPLTKTYEYVFKPNKQAQILAVLGLLLPGPIVNALPLKRNGDIAEASAVIRATCRQLIEEKKANKTRSTDILSVALESGAFTDDNLVDQMMTFLAAGHETTASAMTWAIYLLCLHPDVQSRLRDEVRRNLPSPNDTGTSVSAPDIDHLPYLSAVCAEVLRYYAPVPMTLREAVRDTTVDGVHVPRGTRIMLCPWSVNKDASLWGPDASSFRPERWLGAGSGSGGASSNFAYMTFLHGPRSCIGQGFAKASRLHTSWLDRRLSLDSQTGTSTTRRNWRSRVVSRRAGERFAGAHACRFGMVSHLEI